MPKSIVHNKYVYAAASRYIQIPKSKFDSMTYLVQGELQIEENARAPFPCPCGFLHPKGGRESERGAASCSGREGGMVGRPQQAASLCPPQPASLLSAASFVLSCECVPFIRRRRRSSQLTHPWEEEEVTTVLFRYSCPWN